MVGEEARERGVAAAVEVRMPPERGLELVGPSGAAEERKPARSVQEGLLPGNRRRRGSGTAPEAGAEWKAA